MINSVLKNKMNSLLWKTSFIQNALTREVKDNTTKYGYYTKSGEFIVHNPSGPSEIITEDDTITVIHALHGVTQSLDSMTPYLVEYRPDYRVRYQEHKTPEGILYSGCYSEPSIKQFNKQNELKYYVYNDEQGQIHRDPKEGPALHSKKDGNHLTVYADHGSVYRPYKDGPAKIITDPKTGHILLRKFTLLEEDVLPGTPPMIYSEEYYPDTGKIKVAEYFQKFSNTFKWSRIDKQGKEYIKDTGVDSIVIVKNYDGNGFNTKLTWYLGGLKYQVSKKRRGLKPYTTKYIYNDDEEEVGKDIMFPGSLNIVQYKCRVLSNKCRRVCRYTPEGKLFRVNYDYDNSMFDETTYDLIGGKEFDENGNLVTIKYFGKRDGVMKLLTLDPVTRKVLDCSDYHYDVTFVSRKRKDH